MPIYEFNCSKCGIIEVYLRTTEKVPKKCNCGKPLKKILSASSIGIDGSGRSTVNQDSRRSIGGDFISDGNFSITPSR